MRTIAFAKCCPATGSATILTTHEKISYALVDGPAYDLSLENAPATRHYNGVNGPLVGISVGWADLYSSTLPGQWADLTGLADGEYWLETVIDPFDRILEKDELNNTTIVKINVVVPEPTILAGDYNRDGTVDAVDYTRWRDTLGAKVNQGSGADGDGGGRIGLPDYDVWKAHFGDTEPGAGGVTVVPEPAGVGLALAAAGVLAARGASGEREPWPRTERSDRMSVMSTSQEPNRREPMNDLTSPKPIPAAPPELTLWRWLTEPVDDAMALAGDRPVDSRPRLAALHAERAGAGPGDAAVGGRWLSRRDARHALFPDSLRRRPGSERLDQVDLGRHRGRHSISAGRELRRRLDSVQLRPGKHPRPVVSQEV